MYGIQGIPAMWLVDKDGNLVDMKARSGLDAKVEKLLANNPAITLVNSHAPKRGFFALCTCQPIAARARCALSRCQRKNPYN